MSQDDLPAPGDEEKLKAELPEVDSKLKSHLARSIGNERNPPNDGGDRTTSCSQRPNPGRANEAGTSPVLARILPRLIFATVNQRVARRLMAGVLLVTGLTGLGAGKSALPALWKDILPAIKRNVSAEAGVVVEPYFAMAFVFSLVGVIFLTMIIARILNAQFVLTAARASFALSLLWLVCAIMGMMPESLMGLHRVFIVLVVGLGVAYVFTSGNLTFYLRQRFYGDAVIEIVLLSTYLVLALIPLPFALTGGVAP